MKKTSITKPQFGKIFIVRFLVLCMATFIAAAFVLTKFDEYAQDIRRSTRDAYRHRIEKAAADLSKTEPGTQKYGSILSEMRVAMFNYQMTDYNYAEAVIGGKKYSTDKDTAFILYRTTSELKVYSVDEMSCFEPLYEFMNGKYNPKTINEHWAKYSLDPVIVRIIGDRYDQKAYRLMN